MKGLHKRTYTGWEPVDEQANKILRRYKFGELAELENTIKRNVGFHRKFFAVLNLTFKNQDKAENMTDFRYYILIKSGHYHLILDGMDAIKVPDSISFENMDDIEFQLLYNDVFNVCLRILGCKSEELELQLLKFD